MPLRVLFSAFRTPLILLSGLLLFIFSETLIPNIVLVINSYRSPDHLAGLAIIWHADSLLYIPNVVIFLACLVGSFALLEAKRVLLPRNKNAGWDLVTVLVSLGVALAPLLLLTDARGGQCSLLLARGVQVMPLWLVMVFNANLYVFDKYLASKKWCARLLDWTFPVSDIVFYMFHRQRLGAAAGAVRFLPSLSYVAILALALGVEARILFGAIRAERMDVPVDGFTYWVEYSNGGFWFSNMKQEDPRSGIWYYDERARVAYSYIRILDPQRFLLDDGFFYFFDRFYWEVLKVEAKTRQVIWRVPIKRGFGSFELAVRDNLIFAVGEAGLIVAIGKNGKVYAERQFPFRTWSPQALSDGRIAFLSGSPRVRIWDSRLTAGETIDLPLPDGAIKFNAASGRTDDYMIVTTWTAYVDHLNTLYVATFWGEIFRYDVNRHRWLPSLKTRPGLRSFAVDSQNGLLFAANYYKGYIDVIDLESGKHVKYIIAGPHGRFINLDADKMRGILNTGGWGMYRFDYRDLVGSKSAMETSANHS